MSLNVLDEAKKHNLTVPNHIAIIMDGNGRWASGFAKPRVWGHHKGAKAVRTTIESCRTLGVKYLTLYAFSDENWSRPKYEVETIMNLLFKYLKKEEANLAKNNIRLSVIGDTGRLPEATRTQLDKTMDALKDNDGMVLVLALSYGSKSEITSAVKDIASKIESGELSAKDVCAETIQNHLWTSDMPDPDLMIRTSGEQRLSNFLLWQLAYAEFYFTNVCWPDFNEKELLNAIKTYNGRDRRFGGVVESRPLSDTEVKELSQEEL